MPKKSSSNSPTSKTKKSTTSTSSGTKKTTKKAGKSAQAKQSASKVTRKTKSAAQAPPKPQALEQESNAKVPDATALTPPPPQATFEQQFDAADRAMVEWMQAHPKAVMQHRQHFMQQLLKKRCSYGHEGGILPVTLSPMFLKQSSLDRIAKVAEELDLILDKAIGLYHKDPYVKAYFPYPDIPLEWIHWERGYKKPTMLSRHDALFDGKDLKFIEFNTDNPGGRGWVDTYEELMIASPMYREMLQEYCQLRDRPMLHALKDALLRCYAEWGGSKKKPRVALVSFKEFLPGSDSEIVRDFLIEHGIEANFIDPREFEYRNGKLYSGNVSFDIINICLRFTFFKRFPREMSDFLQALADNAVCCVNHFSATLGSQKEMLSFLSNEENHHYFTKKEAQCIADHIPWTRKMDETITISKDGQDISLYEYVLKQRDDLVLKPTWAAGGYDVYVGKFTDKEKWASAVQNAMGCPWWIVQEAVGIPEYEFPMLKDSQVVLEKKNLNLNPYVFDGKYVGCLGRISESKVINVSAGGGIIPVFALKTK